MKFKEVRTKKEWKSFYKISDIVYKNLKCHRSTEDDITKILVHGKSAYHSHADVKSFLVLDEDTIGRFSLIHDKKLKDYIQVSFLEILPEYKTIVDNIIQLAKEEFPGVEKIVFGLNGHLNYGAGYLLSHFDKVPLFGLPYTPEYYPKLFENLKRHEMFSFIYSMENASNFINAFKDKQSIKNISIRTMNLKNLKNEVKLYTHLNNISFQQHPFWSDRSWEEDFELFHPFRFLLKEENLLFAEVDGEPAGFLLWYPDFNQLVKDDSPLGLKHVLAYKFFNKIKTYRLTEIAVNPKFSRKPVAMAMMVKLIEIASAQGMEIGEGGFIFKSNTKSINFTLRCFERNTGAKVDPYRKFAVYESSL